MGGEEPGDLAPRLEPGPFVFDVVEDAALSGALQDGDWVAVVREAEGVTVVRPASGHGRGAGGFEAAMITLDLTSGLDWIGLSAAVTTALADAGIACNVVAGAHHDHLFVPVQRAHDALAVLQSLRWPPAGG